MYFMSYISYRYDNMPEWASQNLNTSEIQAIVYFECSISFHIKIWKVLIKTDKKICDMSPTRNEMIETDNTSHWNSIYAHFYVICMAYIEISHFYITNSENAMGIYHFFWRIIGYIGLWPHSFLVGRLKVFVPKSHPFQTMINHYNRIDRLLKKFLETSLWLLEYIMCEKFLP